MALDASSLRKIVYKTVEDSTAIAAAQAKLVEFSGDFAADIFVEAGDYKFSVEISSEGKYAFSMIDFGAGTSKFYVATDGTSVYLKRTDASDVAENIGSVTVRKGIRFGEIEDAAIAADSTGSLTWRQIDKTYSTQLESLTVDGNFNLRSDLDVNGGDITTTQTTFNLINTNATTLNIGGAATTLNLAAASGTVNVNSTVNSTSATSGALVVDGGIGVANNAYIGSNANVAGTLSVTGNAGIGQSSGTEKLEVTGNAKIVSAATTGDSLSITADSLTTGSIISASSTSTNTTFPNLIEVTHSGESSTFRNINGEKIILFGTGPDTENTGINLSVGDTASGYSGSFSAKSNTGAFITAWNAQTTTGVLVQSQPKENSAGKSIGIDIYTGFMGSTTSSGYAGALAIDAFAYAGSDSVTAVGGLILGETEGGDAIGVDAVAISEGSGVSKAIQASAYQPTDGSKAYAVYSAYGTNYLAGNTGIGQLPGTERLEVTGNIKATGDLAVNGGDITTSSQNLSIGHSGYSGSNPGISIGAIGTTVSIPGNLVVSGTTTYTGSASYNSINITGDLTSSTFPFEIRDTSESPQTVFSVGYNGSMYVRGDTEIDGSLTVDGASFSIDSTSSSNATVIGATSTASNLTLAAGNSSSGTADVLISAKSEIDLDANAIDLNSDTSVTIDGADFSIDGTASSNITLTGNSGSAVNLTISSTNSGASTGNVLISADEEVDITSGSIDVNVTTGTIDGAITLTGSLAVDNLLLNGTEISTTEDTITINPNSDGAANTGTVIIAGNLQVDGTTTTINTTDLLVSDNTITLNSGYTGSSPSANAGIEVERGTLDNKASLIWNEASDKWQFNDGTTTFDFVKNTDLPTGFSITAGSTDGIFDIAGTSGTNSVSYSVSPYDTKTVGGFDDGSTNPDGTTRLNWNGYLYATKLYSGGNEVYTSANLPAYPTGFSISAGSTDGIFDITGTGGTNSVSYEVAPYSSKQPSGVHFYTGSAAAPSNTDRLNLDATLWATNVYSGGSEVLTSADLGSSIAQDLQAVTDNGSSTSQAITVGGITVGSGSANGTVQSNGNYDLIVKTGNATTGSITIADGSNGDITVSTNGSGATVFSNTTDASSSTVASVEVAGGVGIAKKLFVGTDLSVGGDLTLTNDLTVANGGTGASTFTTYGLLYGNGTSAISATSSGTVGDVIGVVGSPGVPSWRRVMKHYTNTSSDLTFGNGAGGGWIASTSHTVTDLAPFKYYYIRFVGAYDKNAAGGTAAKVGMSCAITGGTGMAVNGKLYIKKDSGDGADEVVSSLTTATSAGDAANTVETPEEVTTYSDLPLGMEAILYTGTSGTVTVTMNFRHPFGATSGWFIRINRHSALVVTELV